MDEDGDSNEDESIISEGGEQWLAGLQRIKENDPNTTFFKGTAHNYIENMTNENWEEFGRDIANNTHLTEFGLSRRALNDHRMTYILFRGLTRSSSIKVLELITTSMRMDAVD